MSCNRFKILFRIFLVPFILFSNCAMALDNSTYGTKSVSKTNYESSTTDFENFYIDQYNTKSYCQVEKYKSLY